MGRHCGWQWWYPLICILYAKYAKYVDMQRTHTRPRCHRMVPVRCWIYSDTPLDKIQGMLPAHTHIARVWLSLVFGVVMQHACE